MPRFARGISFTQLAFYLEQVQQRCARDLAILGEPTSDQRMLAQFRIRGTLDLADAVLHFLRTGEERELRRQGAELPYRKEK